MKMVFISTMIFVNFLLRNLEKINHIFRRHECLCKNEFSTVALMRFIVGPIPFGAGEEAGSWPACPLWHFWWKRWIVLWKARFCERSWVLLFITVIFHYVWWFMIGIWDIVSWVGDWWIIWVALSQWFYEGMLNWHILTANVVVLSKARPGVWHVWHTQSGLSWVILQSWKI